MITSSSQDGSCVYQLNQASLRAMKLLAIDTSTEACSAALKVNDDIMSRYEVAPRKHAELILPMIDELMKEAGLAPQQLDGLAFGRGPGAFTGVRIAAGIIQGIAFAAELPVASVSSLAAIAQAVYRQRRSTRVIAAIDARMNEIYCCYYQAEQGIMQACVEECLNSAESVSIPDQYSWVGAGSGWSAYNRILTQRFSGRLESYEGNIYPDAQDILTLGEQAFLRGETVSADQVAPVYLRDKIV